MYKLSCNPKIAAGWWEAQKNTSKKSLSGLDLIRQRSSKGSRGESVNSTSNLTKSSATNMTISMSSIQSYNSEYNFSGDDIEDLTAPNAGLWAIECVAWTCIDGTTAEVDVVKLLHTLSMYPSELLEGRGCMLPPLLAAVGTSDPIPVDCFHVGLSRAAATLSLIQKSEYFSDHGYLKFPFREKLSFLLGPKLLSRQLVQLISVVDAAESKTDKKKSIATCPSYESFLYELVGEANNSDSNIHFLRDSEDDSTYYQSITALIYLTESENMTYKMPSL